MGNGPSNLARTFSEDIGEVREIIFIVCLVLSSRYYIILLCILFCDDERTFVSQLTTFRFYLICSPKTMKVLRRAHQQHQPRRTRDHDVEKRRRGRQRPTLKRRRAFRQNHRRVTFGKSGNEKVPRKQNGERTHRRG